MNGPGKRQRGRNLTDTPRNRTRTFASAEDGVMMVFGLIIFMIILMIGGMAVDLMRYESQRVKLQSVGDRAALAAASLSQPFIPEDVAADYFEKEGLEDYLVRPVRVHEGLNFRNVTVSSECICPRCSCGLSASTS